MKKILLLLFFPLCVFAQTNCALERGEYYTPQERYGQLTGEIVDDTNSMDLFNALWEANQNNQFSAHLPCQLPVLISQKYDMKTGKNCDEGDECIRFVDDLEWRNFIKKRALIPNKQFDALPLLGFWQSYNAVRLEITPEKVRDNQWEELLSELEKKAPLSALPVMSGIDIEKVHSEKWKSAFLDLVNDENAALLSEYMTIENATDEVWTSLIQFMIDNHVLRLDRELLNQLTFKKIHDLKWNTEARYFIEKYPDDFGQIFAEGLTLDIVHDPLKLAFLHHVTDSKERFSGLEMKGFSERFSGKNEINPEVKSLLMHILEACPEIDLWQTQNELTVEKVLDPLWREAFENLVLKNCRVGAGSGTNLAHATKNLSLRKVQNAEWRSVLTVLTKNDKYPSPLFEHISIEKALSYPYIDFLKWYKWYLFQNKDDDTPFDGSLGIQWRNWYKVTPQQTNDPQWLTVAKYLIRNNIKQDTRNQYAFLGLEDVSIEMSHNSEFLQKIQYRKSSFWKRLKEEISFRMGFWQMMQKDNLKEKEIHDYEQQKIMDQEQREECGQYSSFKWGYISFEEANIMQNDIGAITEFLYSQYLEKFKQQDNDVCMEGISDFRGIKFKEAKTTDFRNMYKTTFEYEFFPLEGSHFSNFYEDVIPETWNYRLDATFAIFKDVDGWYGMPGVQWHWGGGGGPRWSMTNIYDNGVLFSFLKARSIKILR